MSLFSRCCILAAITVLLGACSPARTGVSGSTLTMNTTPGIRITAAAPFSPTDHGSLWVTPRTDSMTDSPLASFTYAVYANSAQPDAVAYAAIVTLSDAVNWGFTPQPQKLPFSFGPLHPVAEHGLFGSVQNLCIPASSDWASEFLQAKGAKTPGAWLAQRWVYDLGQGIRAIAEYREPKPDWLDASSRDILLVDEKDLTALREFQKRATVVFTASPLSGDNIIQPVLVERPIPDVATLAGEITRTDRGGDSLD